MKEQTNSEAAVNDNGSTEQNNKQPLSTGLNMADSLQEIANAHGIDSGKFIRFWSTRFGDNPDLSYATTWAKRIRDLDPHKQIDNKSLNAH